MLRVMRNLQLSLVIISKIAHNPHNKWRLLMRKRFTLLDNSQCLWTLCALFAFLNSGFAGETDWPIKENIATNQQIVVVANGILISETNNSCSYKLLDVWYGVVPTNVVRVVFCPDTFPKTGFPEKAILILEKAECFPANWLFALGEDASLGVLPYSAERWSEIKKTSLAVLSQTPVDRRITRDKAIVLATERVTKEGRPRNGEIMQCDALRNNFGWTVYVTFMQQSNRFIIGDDIIILVGDDGKIKSYQHGL